MKLQIVLAMFACFSASIEASVIPAPPALRYTLIAPQNVRPFAAQVSTFTRGLNVLEAPLAAGVLNPPAIFSRTLPAAPLIEAPSLHPRGVAVGPFASPLGGLEYVY
ncbi:unnamed protein product [Phyllotreta striolata]|uniref:Uncharacterized protein n=1 Tax=Phyllotreta striolata TaxID=444603 RepID=A0A9P0GRX5_PHYSR|nr:unnamed protein product [Phyllotreta striolata]